MGEGLLFPSLFPLVFPPSHFPSTHATVRLLIGTWSPHHQTILLPTKSRSRIDETQLSIILNFHERKFFNRYFIFIFQRNDQFLPVFKFLKGQSLHSSSFLHYQENKTFNARIVNQDRQICICSTLNSNKLDEKVKILGKQSQVLNYVSYFRVIRWWLVDFLLAISLVVKWFGGKMTINLLIKPQSSYNLRSNEVNFAANPRKQVFFYITSTMEPDHFLDEYDYL